MEASMNSPTAAVSTGTVFRSGQDATVDDRTSHQPPDVRVWWELRHARLRLALAENDIAWAQEALAGGNINTEAALALLDQALDEIVGDAR
jgi:hypothetical protein